MKKLLIGVWRSLLKLLYPLYEPGRPKLDWKHWRIAASTVLANVELPALPESAERVRRNLLAISILAFVLIVGGVEVEEQTAIYGVKLPRLGGFWIVSLVVGVLVYQIIHYGWLFLDTTDAWKLKLSGLRTDLPELRGQLNHDRAVKPKHQTLHGWWHEHSTNLDSWNQLKEDIKNLEEQIKRQHVGGDVDTALKQIREQVSEIKAVLESNELRASLANFDNFHMRLTRSQMLRWLILDYYLPVGFGVASALGLICSAAAL